MMLAYPIHSIGRSATAETPVLVDLKRDDNVPSSTQQGGIFTIGKPRLERLQGGFERSEWWREEFACLKMSRVMIVDVDRDGKCWNEWLDRYRTEWEKAAIDGQEGK